MMKTLIVAAAASAAVAASGSAQTRGSGSGTVSYWMSAETMSGIAAMAGGQQGGRAAMMRAMMGGGARGPGYTHNLMLQLGSPRRPAGAPEAEHVPPAGLDAGPSLPLVSPEPSHGAPAGPREPWQRADGQPQGRILIYWGCGEHARPGQPFEIDLSHLAPGQMPPAMANLPFRPMTPPNAGSSTTYGEWPNARERTPIPANGSLVGDHLIHGNYSPDIRFSLAQGQDFLAPITLTSNTRAASGAVPVAWQAVPNARGYFLMSFAARADHTMVLWTSSEAQLAQFAAFDYLAPAEAARLVQQRVLLSPQTTQCTVPAEVSQGAQGASLMMSAFGPEANFSYPVRPANAPRGWAPEWTVKLRTRSAYMGLLGMDMAAMMRGEDASESPDRQQPRERQRRHRSPLGGLLGRVVGQ